MRGGFLRDDITRALAVSGLGPPPPPSQAAIEGTAGTAAQSSGTTLRVPVPAGVVAGEILEMCVYARSISAVLSGTEAGWTLYLTQNGGGGSHVRLWRVATGSEPADYGVNTTISTIMLGAMIRISGADTAAPITAFNSGIGTSQPVAPNVAGSVAGNLVLRGTGGFYSPAGAATAAWDAPVTELSDQSQSSGLMTTGWETATGTSTGARSVTESKDGVVTTPGGFNASTVVIANG